MEDEEEVEGVFYNDMYSLELDKAKWHQVLLRGKKDLAAKKKRRKKKETQEGAGDGADDDEDKDEGEEEEEEEEEDMEEELEVLTMEDTEDHMEAEQRTSPAGEPEPANSKMDVEIGTTPTTEAAPIDPTVSPPGDCSQENDIFTVTVASQSKNETDTLQQGEQPTQQEMFTPGKRMNTLLAVKHGILYMYGGVFEVGDKQYTLSDMYSLDLHKLDQWNTIIASTLDLQAWEDSEESSGEEEEEEVEGEEGEEEEEEGDEEMEDDSDEEDEEDDDEEMTGSRPDVKVEETLDDYYERTSEHWLTEASQVAQDEGMQVSEKQLKKAASRMAKEHYKEQHPV